MKKSDKPIKKLSKKGPLIALGCFFGVLILLGIFANNSNIKSSNNSNLIDEYNNYINLYNSDIGKINSLYNNWVDAFNNAVKDKQLTSGEVSLIKDSIDNYASEYNIVKQHLTSFKSFIEGNQQDLKGLTIDTFKMKTNIDDAISGMENSVNYMKTKTQELIDSYQAQQQALGNILKILIGLA